MTTLCEKILVIALVVSTGLGFRFGISIGKGMGIARVKHWATEAGVAEYVCDPTTGDTTFEWKEKQ